MNLPSLLATGMSAWMILTASTLAAQDPSKIMVVLDASGSMWGQIDGRAKIEIAREAMADFLKNTEPEVEIGLIAYGHRRKGDCDDIEVLAAPTTDRSKLLQQVNALTPRGKTPLSDAVRVAAEALKFEENAASVMLITDGLETCGGDPCALGKELEQLGVDFVCHVVGFDVQGLATGDLECLAKETGGLYVTANDVEQLTSALEGLAQETVEPASVVVRAVEGEEGPSLSPVTFRWRLTGSEEMLKESTGRESRVSLEAGSYVVTGTYQGTTAKLEIEVGEEEAIERELIFELPQAEASLDAPEQVKAGNRFEVAWEGPGNRYDDILLAEPGEKALRTERIRDNNPVTLIAPIKPGEYELRYWHASRNRVLATHPIEVLSREPEIIAEEAVPISDEFTVTFKDRPENARYSDLQIVKPGEDKALRSQRIRGESVSIAALSESGDYELRLWNGDNRVELARRPIRFEAVEVAWTLPETIRMAEPFTVKFENRPEGRYDDLVIYDEAQDKVIRTQRIRSLEQVTITAPAEPGEYQVRYKSGDDRVMAKTQIDVQPVDLVWQVPATVPIGSPMEITFDSRPKAPYQDIQIHDPESGKNVRTKRIRGDKVRLESPGEPGEYEVRYWIGTGSRVLETAPLRVMNVEVEWEVPDTVIKDEPFTVTLGNRPRGGYDDLKIYHPETKKNVRTKRIRGAKVTLRVPEEPGEYELRYWMGSSNKTQATKPLKVE